MHKVKKQNILMMLNFLINQELQIFHTKEIDKRYSVGGDDFVIGDYLKKARISAKFWLLKELMMSLLVISEKEF
jgi:hypothetical protein